MAINVSSYQLRSGHLADTVGRAVAASGIQWRDLEIEVTESLLVSGSGAALQQLQALREAGATVAIDDFGTGYSSLGYLRTFPIHALKIDRSFVRDIDRDPNSAALAEAIIAMAGSLRLKVVAEGVETTAQLGQLRRFGCQELQGYIFSKPLPPEELLALLEEGRRLPLAGA